MDPAVSRVPDTYQKIARKKEKLKEETITTRVAHQIALAAFNETNQQIEKYGVHPDDGAQNANDADVHIAYTAWQTALAHQENFEINADTAIENYDEAVLAANQGNPAERDAALRAAEEIFAQEIHRLTGL